MDFTKTIADIQHLAATAIEPLRKGDDASAQKIFSELLHQLDFMLKELKTLSVRDGLSIEVLNLASHLCDYFLKAHMDEALKPTAALFKKYAGLVRVLQPDLSYPQLQLLVNCRKYNKRLPRDLSEYIRNVIDGDVNSIGDFWKDFHVVDSLKGKLRKLFIQSQALRLYNFDPNTSYTHKLLDELIPGIVASDDAEVHLLFAQISYYTQFDSIFIRKYGDLIDTIIPKTKDETDIVRLNTAKILYREFMTENNIHDYEDVAVLRDEDMADMKALIARHPKWIDHVGKFLMKQEQGMNIADYCKSNGLPCDEFSCFYNAAMQDMANAIEKSPFLAKLASLPIAEQEEYQRLVRSKNELVEKLCAPLSRILNRKITYQKIAQDQTAFDSIMKEALKETNMKKHHKAYMSILMTLFDIDSAERNLDLFCSRHGLQIPH